LLLYSWGSDQSFLETGVVRKATASALITLVNRTTTFSLGALSIYEATHRQLPCFPGLCKCTRCDDIYFLLGTVGSEGYQLGRPVTGECDYPLVHS